MTVRRTRILSLALATAMLPALFFIRVGEGDVPEVVCASTAAVAATQSEPISVVPGVPTVEAMPAAQQTPATDHAPIDTPQAVRESAARDDADTGVVTLFEFGKEYLCTYLAGADNRTVKLVDTGAELPEFFYEYTDKNGDLQEVPMGMYFDEEHQLLIGKDNQGTFATGFDVDLNQRMIYAAHNGWERRFGFNPVYDFLAPAALIYFQTHRIKFEYGGMDWKIQIWKGNYFLAGSGGEVGIYNKPQSRPVEHYDCVGDEDMLVMSLRVLKGEELLFERAPERHWWMTGFALTDGIYFADALTLESTILFEEQGMLDAFLPAFDPICAAEGITYTVDGLLVSFVW